MRTTKAALLLITTATAVLLLIVPAHAGGNQHARFYWNKPDKMGEVVKGSSARLDREPSAVHLRVKTRGLKPGHAYTLWMVVFNNPEGCHGNPGQTFHNAGVCGMPDAFSPASGASHHRAGGAVIGKDGSATFSSRIRRGAPSELSNEPPLENPQGAEYMLVVRDHGPAVKGSDQTTSLNGGCLVPAPPGEGSQGTYMCANEQTANFGTS